LIRTKDKSLLLIVSAIVVIGCGFLLLPVRDWFSQFQGRIENMGALGPVVFVIIYAASTALLIPGSVMTIGAGTIFGLRTGAITVIIGANLGALIAFLLSRSLLREKVEKWAEGSRKFAALDRAIEDEGFRVVLLSRLSPVFPFTLLNYLLGLTRIGIGSYLSANLIGMLPGTFLYVYLGAAARDALDGGEASLFRQALKYAGLLATMVIVVLITRSARRALNQLEKGDVEKPSDTGASQAQ
jgi:uncharacterized membrane protein YdjX (TVP38/TMEM64 family)